MNELFFLVCLIYFFFFNFYLTEFLELANPSNDEMSEKEKFLVIENRNPFLKIKPKKRRIQLASINRKKFCTIFRFFFEKTQTNGLEMFRVGLARREFIEVRKICSLINQVGLMLVCRKN